MSVCLSEEPLADWLLTQLIKWNSNCQISLLLQWHRQSGSKCSHCYLTVSPINLCMLLHHFCISCLSLWGEGGREGGLTLQAALTQHGSSQRCCLLVDPCQRRTEPQRKRRRRGRRREVVNEGLKFSLRCEWQQDFLSLSSTHGDTSLFIHLKVWGWFNLFPMSASRSLCDHHHHHHHHHHQTHAEEKKETF